MCTLFKTRICSQLPVTTALYDIYQEGLDSSSSSASVCCTCNTVYSSCAGDLSDGTQAPEYNFNTCDTVYSSWVED